MRRPRKTAKIKTSRKPSSRTTAVAEIVAEALGVTEDETVPESSREDAELEKFEARASRDW